MSNHMIQWIVNKFNKLEVMIGDITGRRRPLLHDLFFKNSPRSVEYGWVLNKISSVPQRILDIGCKGTRFPLLLANLGHEVTGTDLKNYGGEHPNFRFVRGDILEEDTRKKLHGQEFDVITLISTLEHIGILGRDSENLDLDADVRLLRHLRKLFREDGVILATIPCGFPTVRGDQKIYGDDEIDDLVEKSLLVTRAKDFFVRDSYFWKSSKHPIEENRSVATKGIKAICCLKLGVKSARDPQAGQRW